MEKIDLNGKTILVTGSAGFIGSNLVKRLFKDLKDAIIVGIDNMNDYYDVSLKEWRLNEIEGLVPAGIKYVFVKGDIASKETIDQLFETYKPQVVVNLAAQAGVRYSITNPDAYIQSNLIGFYNILEACRNNPVEHLVYASSSSVYGGNKKVPFSTDDRVDNPVSLYAATKKSNELMAHCYSKLYDIPSTGLRSFVSTISARSRFCPLFHPARRETRVCIRICSIAKEMVPGHLSVRIAGFLSLSATAPDRFKGYSSDVMTPRSASTVGSQALKSRTAAVRSAGHICVALSVPP